MGPGRPLRFAVAVAVAVAAGAFAVGPAQAAASPEARVKAAYLFKLASFVRWPDGATGGSRFRFCMSGSRDVAQVLADLARGQRVHGLPLSVETIDPAQPAQVRSCHIVYVGRGRDAARAAMSAASGLPILTVADRTGGTAGGVLDFLNRDGKVRFVIDRSIARRQGLELSSKLLDTAAAVQP